MTRLQLTAIWSAVKILLESLAFFTVGFELPHLVQTMSDAGELAGVWGPAAAILATVILVRIIWVLPGMWAPRSWLRARETRREERRALIVVAWAGMRGPVSAFAALGLPLMLDDGSAFPMRDQLLLVTSIVVVVTLLVQGSTLGPLMRRLGAISPHPRDQ